MWRKDKKKGQHSNEEEQQKRVCSTCGAQTCTKECYLEHYQDCKKRMSKHEEETIKTIAYILAKETRVRMIEDQEAGKLSLPKKKNKFGENHIEIV